MKGHGARTVDDVRMGDRAWCIIVRQTWESIDHFMIKA